jgi:HD-like signal output (HDOD) protein
LMIGINPFFREFQDLPLIEDQLKPHPKALLGLLKVIGRSRKAAVWSREWAAARHDMDIDEITVAALLHDFAEILMWCFAPTLAIKVREAQLSDRTLRSVAVQEEIYGLPLYALKAALAKNWNLPALLSMLMDNENAENPRVRNVKLAVDMARHSANGWDDAALPDDLQAVEDLIHIAHDHLLQKLGVDPSQLYQPPPEEPAADTPQLPPTDQPQ